jgi:pimeloyl-ACP methyl ester carboxylesterase
MHYRVFYRTAKVDGLSIFYREAGPPDAPVILLLHLPQADATAPACPTRR